MISSDDELAQAFDYYKGKLFRLYVKAGNYIIHYYTLFYLSHFSFLSSIDLADSPEDPEPGDNPERKGPVHPGVICDGCNGSIYGSRFKCLICTDYDLCSGCEGKGIHVDHNMVELEKPSQFGLFGGPPFADGWLGHPGAWGSGGCHRGRGRRSGGRGAGPCSWNPSSQGGYPYRRWGTGGRCDTTRGGRAGPWFSGEGRQCKPECKPESKPTEDQPADPEAMDTDQKGSTGEDERRKYLRNVGNAVSNFLEPFGIKVDVGVVGDEDGKKAGSDASATGGESTAVVSDHEVYIVSISTSCEL